MQIFALGKMILVSFDDGSNCHCRMVIRNVILFCHRFCRPTLSNIQKLSHPKINPNSCSYISQNQCFNHKITFSNWKPSWSTRNVQIAECMHQLQKYRAIILPQFLSSLYCVWLKAYTGIEVQPWCKIILIIDAYGLVYSDIALFWPVYRG